jgi:hypothetical protein
MPDPIAARPVICSVDGKLGSSIRILSMQAAVDQVVKALATPAQCG